MIGQKKLLERLKQISEGNFARFTIISGGRGGGKTLLSAEIARQLGADLVLVETKVDNIRQVIDLAYKQVKPVVYLVAHADKMSIAAKNALLKITEEPPRKAYFIMTLEDLNNTLGTLRSRGTILPLDPYTPLELAEYANSKGYELNSNELDIMSQVCQVPGDVDLLARYDIENFYSFVEKVLNNIGKVNGANAFKIGTSLAYKEGDSGWDISLFFRAIMHECRKRLIETKDARLRDTIKVTSKYLSQLSINGVNKPSTMDMWVLETRGIWMEDEE